MKNSNCETPFQVLFSRFAAELKDALQALREAESTIEFELAVRHLQQVIEGLEGAGA